MKKLLVGLFILGNMIVQLQVQADVWNFAKMKSYTSYNYFGDKSSPFTYKQKKSIRSYQGLPLVNRYLRGQREATRELERDTHYLDNAMLKINFPYELILFRGVNLNYRNHNVYSVGDEFQDLGYTSTSINIKVANKIAVDSLYVMYSSKDFKGLWIGGNRFDTYQEELLLPRGSKFKVMDSKVKNGKNIQLIQICAKLCDEYVAHPDVELLFLNL